MAALVANGGRCPPHYRVRVANAFAARRRPAHPSPSASRRPSGLDRVSPVGVRGEYATARMWARDDAGSLRSPIRRVEVRTTRGAAPAPAKEQLPRLAAGGSATRERGGGPFERRPVLWSLDLEAVEGAAAGRGGGGASLRREKERQRRQRRAGFASCLLSRSDVLPCGQGERDLEGGGDLKRLSSPMIRASLL